jgi:2'-5' RNA ligase
LKDDDYVIAQEQLFAELETGGIATTVPARTDYVGKAVGLSILAFVRTDIAAAIDERVIRPLRAADASQHFYAPADFHITIKNIRCAQEAPTFTFQDVTRVRHALTEAIPHVPPITFNLNGLVRFPRSVALRAFATSSFVAVVKMLDDLLRACGMTDDKVYQSRTVFCGNVTLCRFASAPNCALLDCVANLRDLYLGALCITELHLVECDEVCSESSRIVHAALRLSGSGARMPTCELPGT